jgi:hypothetical protein
LIVHYLLANKKMVHEIFDPSLIHYDEYLQFGEGMDGADYDYFRGPLFQRGFGIQGGK